MFLVCVLIVPAIISPALASSTYTVTTGPQNSGGTVYSVVNGAQTTNPVTVPAGSEWDVHVHPATGWHTVLIYVVEHNQPARSFGHSNPWGPDDAYQFYNINAPCQIWATFAPN